MRIENARRSVTALSTAAVALVLGISEAWAAAGRPSPWEMGMQEMVTELGQSASDFHTYLVWLIAAMMIMTWRGYKRAREGSDNFYEGLTLGTFGALLGFSISSLTNYNLGDAETLMMLLCVVGLSSTLQPHRGSPINTNEAQ